MDLSGFVRKRTKIVLGEMEFVFSELSLLDLAKFRAHLVEQRKKLNDKRRERLLTAAERIGQVDAMELLKFTDSSLSEKEFEEQMETTEGLGYLAYLSLKYAYPEISQDDAMIIMSVNADLLDLVTEAMLPIPASEKEKMKAKAKNLKVGQKKN